jgi:hypothetical protein
VSQSKTLSATAYSALVGLATRVSDFKGELTETELHDLRCQAREALHLLPSDKAFGQEAEIHGKMMALRNGKGHLVPVDQVKAEHLLEDQVVRKAFHYAAELSAQISRFKGYTLAEIAGFLDLLAQQYGVKPSAKGNVTLMSYDQLLKVQLKIAQLFDFGPELQAAKALFDECLVEWGQESRPELFSVVQDAFNVDSAGKINRSSLFALMRLQIDDERWQRAMAALRDSMRPVGSKEYVNFYRRESLTAKWEAVTIDVAAA